MVSEIVTVWRAALTVREVGVVELREALPQPLRRLVPVVDVHDLQTVLRAVEDAARDPGIGVRPVDPAPGLPSLVVEVVPHFVDVVALRAVVDVNPVQAGARTRRQRRRATLRGIVDDRFRLAPRRRHLLRGCRAVYRLDFGPGRDVKQPPIHFAVALVRDCCQRRARIGFAGDEGAGDLGVVFQHPPIVEVGILDDVAVFVLVVEEHSAAAVC